MKAARLMQGNNTTYDQGHQVLAKRDAVDKFQSKKGYELLIPYLEEFQKKKSGHRCCL
jgi:hypothetical protein